MSDKSIYNFKPPTHPKGWTKTFKMIKTSSGTRSELTRNMYFRQKPNDPLQSETFSNFATENGNILNSEIRRNDNSSNKNNYKRKKI
jgi:hypothetical protein